MKRRELLVAAAVAPIAGFTPAQATTISEKVETVSPLTIRRGGLNRGARAAVVGERKERAFDY